MELHYNITFQVDGNVRSANKVRRRKVFYNVIVLCGSTCSMIIMKSVNYFISFPPRIYVI